MLLIRLLERLVRSMKGRRVYLILNKLRLHHSKPMKAWRKEHQTVIAVFYLPSYIPELNQDEHHTRALKSTLSNLPAVNHESGLRK